MAESNSQPVAKEAEERKRFSLWTVYRYQKVMWRVVLATVPAMLAAIYFFGWRALAVIALSIAAGSFVEWLFCRARKEPISSAVFVTAILYALTLPPHVPYYVELVGIVVAIMFGKEVFGGYARNIFNPALVGRCFVYICFPVDMTAHWLAPYTSWPGGLAHWVKGVDAFTRATPLTVFKSGEGLQPLGNLLFGYTGGSLGETSALLIIIGGIYMMVTRTANWRITAGCLIGAVTASVFYGLVGSTAVPGPLFTVLAGGFMFGAVYMATDPISAAQTNPGRWIFGIEVGVLTVIIRGFSNFNGAVMFAILLGNMFSPIMEYYLRAYKQWQRERAKPVAQQKATEGEAA